MNKLAKDANPDGLNWVDYADALRRVTSQRQIAEFVHALTPDASDLIAAPARRSQSSEFAAQVGAPPPILGN
jgi:hypothetical protein